MCTNPRTIFTNARYLSNVCKYTLTVPCGKCEECKESIRSNYLTRAYYESLKTFDSHGVCLFDTLTYNEKSVPRLFGIRCFRHSDIVAFRKALRTYLERKGFDIKDQISYFITSEYGGKTARPHYHILIFAWFKGASCTLLHDAISHCWSYGFTDKRIKQVLLSSNGVGALSYVTKYVSKSMMDSSALDVAVKQGIKNLSDEQVKQVFENFSERFALKHFQSRGFGDYLLKLLSENKKIRFNSIDVDIDLKKEFFENSRIYMPDKKKVFKFYPLGHFYVYKVFFDRVYNPVSGRKDMYVLNEIGKSWKKRNFELSRDKFIDRFVEYKPHIIAEINKSLNDDTFSQPVSFKVLRQKLLDDKIDVKGFAEYVLFYRSLSWLNSQYCPFEFFSADKDYMDILSSSAQIENRAYAKKFVVDGKVVEKPYSKGFRDRLLSRRYDIVDSSGDTMLFETLLTFYNVVHLNYMSKREVDILRKQTARDTNRAAQLLDEKVITR